MIKYSIDNIQLFNSNTKLKNKQQNQNTDTVVNNISGNSKQNESNINKGKDKKNSNLKSNNCDNSYNENLNAEDSNNQDNLKDSSQNNKDDSSFDIKGYNDDINSQAISKEEFDSLKIRITQLENENMKLLNEKSAIEKSYIFRENVEKMRENFEDFNSLESSIYKKIDSEIIELNGLKIKYLYESGYDGLIAAYNMCKFSLGELTNIDEFIEKNINMIVLNEEVREKVIEDYLKDVDEMKIPRVFKSDEGYTSYTKKEEPTSFAQAAKLFLKSIE